ncbi:MAG: ABC transporter ATP-binding protein, partial [Oscillospiraceae bacterium]
MNKKEGFFEKRKREKRERETKEDFIPFKTKINNLVYMNRVIFKYIPGFATFNLIISAFWGFTDIFIEVYFMKWIIELIETSTNSEETFKNIISLGIIAVVIFVIRVILGRLAWSVYWSKASTKFMNILHSELFDKATKIELECYDDPKFYNDFVWSMNNSSNLIIETFGKISSIVLSISSMITAGFFIFTTDIIMISFAVLSIVVSAVLIMIRNKINYKYSLELNPRIVKRDYVSRIFYLPEYGKEIKLTHIGELLLEKYHEFIQEMKNVVRKHGKKMAIITTFDGLAWDFIFFIGNLFYLAYRAIVTGLSFSNFMGLFNATREFHGSISWIMQLIPQIDQQSMMINNFRKFMAYEPKMKDEIDAIDCKNTMGKIQIKNLTYTYKGKNTPALDNINLTINPGEKIAIVGYNGAGKSTLIKLLMRLYDPDSGEIYFENENIKKFKIKSYRDIFGAVFQDFQIFATTVAENVIMDEISDKDKEKINNSLQLSGGLEKIDSLEKKEETQLTREFVDEGVNLSGGESQKIAIARIFAKKCSVAILDEPSSALDPISEYELNKTMLDAAKDKSVIFISHRLSTTRIADRIYMLENGKIIEQGTH